MHSCVAEVHLKCPGIQRNVVHSQVIGWHTVYTDDSSVYDVPEVGHGDSHHILRRAYYYKVEARGTSLSLKYSRSSRNVQHATHRTILIHRWSPLSLDLATLPNAEHKPERVLRERTPPPGLSANRSWTLCSLCAEYECRQRSNISTYHNTLSPTSLSDISRIALAVPVPRKYELPVTEITLT